MTPEQLTQKPFEEIFKNRQEKVDTDEGGSIEEEEKSTTSSDKLEPNSDSDVRYEEEEETNTTETNEVHNILNETTHDEENSSEAKMIHQKMKMSLKCKHMETMGSKTNKKTNSELPTFKLKLKTEKLKGS